MNNPKVLVVGGGIGGLSAALTLQYFGFRPVVFEQTGVLKEIGAGVVITPNAMHALRFLHIGKRIADDAGPADILWFRNLHTGDIIKSRSHDHYVAQYGAELLQVHRADIHAALSEAVLGNDPDCIKLGHRFESLTQDDTQVIAYFENGEADEGDILVGCDGCASRVRVSVFGDEPVNYTGQMAFRALLPMDAVPKGIFERPYALYVGSGRSLRHYPMRHHSVMNVISCVREPKWQEEGWAVPSTIEEFSNLHRDVHPDLLTLIRMLSPEALFKWGLRDREPLATCWRGRVTMLGDAAHPMTPFLGQGACMAIEDAMVLGRSFAVSGSVSEAFEIYENTRKKRANSIQITSRQADDFQGATNKGPNPGRGAAGLYDYNPVSAPLVGIS
jgi:salicylate hydroxylase